ncbi:hypothetical protein OG2516_11226 [Oceanicola granulosus HTCC2516]|uniref:YknX-like barrel-sandwich hybrid domain-containing protein n=1 Tax=Oceanicola granulosus (strain ATCC BAA-861 / DSM 15982 / KCTC 12143 / HTCC2516) TaxID=314256 RepID=Q2CJV8_OCEGH|nr:efflux RND transporter periplasmic adaptor subunit [Oceanicola granulosus]EAR53031.1 hypothetical protein OG2516_11226 [Oceanicola granulosus HTCC2516]
MKPLLFLLLPGAAAAAPLDCLIEPRAIVEIAAADEGRIEEVLVARGDRVAEGDVLVRLDDEMQRLQLATVRSRAESDLEVRAGETRLELRETELARATQLAARNAGAATAVDEARIEVALTEIAIEEARLARTLAGIEAEQAEALLERRVVRSPSDGIVVAVEAARGEYAGQQAILVTLAQIDPLHVEVFAPPQYFNRLSLGDSYMVRQTTPLEGAYMATVSVVDQIFDAASNTFGVRLDLPNPDGTIPAGTRCTVDFDLPE